MLKQGYKQSLMIGSDAVFGGRKLYFEKHGDYDILDYFYAKETIIRRSFDYGCMCSILINGKEYAVNSRGLNIVVYNNMNKCVVDSICFDTHANGEVSKIK